MFGTIALGSERTHFVQVIRSGRKPRRNCVEAARNSVGMTQKQTTDVHAQSRAHANRLEPSVAAFAKVTRQKPSERYLYLQFDLGNNVRYCSRNSCIVRILCILVLL
jgi:hypothetical protein